ncbi:MAG: hypothetical protein ACYTET_03195 [Planctomycetota bacterium]|jgi:hypothetical protein
MRYLLYIIIICLLLAGCNSTQEFNLPSDVNFEDGINKNEAEILANAYFMHYVNGCGGAYPAINEGQRWRVETFVGYGGQPSYPIYIEKETRVIHSKMGPTVEIADFIQTDYYLNYMSQL